MTNVLTKEKKKEFMIEKHLGKKPCEDVRRIRVMLHKSRNARSLRKMEESRKDSPLGSQEGVSLCQDLILDF